MELILVFLILLLLFGGGFYVGRPGYVGWGAGFGGILYIIGAIVVIVVVLRLLGVV